MSKLVLFPQFTRIFSALLLWSALGILIVLNVHTISRKTVNVLGTTTEYDKILRQKQEEKEQTLVLYHYWQGVIREKSDYRDAYITLASLAYQLSDMEMARTYLGISARLDPNSSEVEKLSSLFY